MDDREKIGAEATRQVREETIKAAEEHGVSLDKLMTRLGEALDAKLTKVFNGMDGIVYSKELVDNKTRLEAIKLGLTVHDALPTQRHEIDMPAPLTMILNMGDPEPDDGTDDDQI